MQNPRQYKIPNWFLNRQKDIKDGKTNQVMANFLDNKLREDLERLEKSGLIVVSVITGVSVPEVNIPRLPAVEDVLLVSQKRNKYYEKKNFFLEKKKKKKKKKS